MKLVVCLCLCAWLAPAADSAKAVFEHSVQALVSGDYASAERGFQAVLRDEPRNVGALGNLGVLYSRTDRPDQAIAVYERALRVSPKDKAILLNLGLVYLKQEAHRKALPLFATVVELDPRNAQARQLSAVCRIYTGEVPQAIRDLELLREANPRDEQILFLLGFAYLKSRNPETAKTIFEKMLDVAGPARAQFLLGKACYEAAVFDRAEESFLDVIKLEPAFPGVRLELGKTYISERRAADALRELGLALKQNPDDEEANYYLGSLLVQENRNEEGIRYLEAARKLRPGSWSVYLHLGKARLQQGRPKDAVPLLERAVALNPDEGSTYYQLARALQASGRQPEAKRAFQKARDLAH